MILRDKHYLYLAGAALALVAVFWFSCEQRKQGALDSQATTLRHENDSLKKARKQSEVVYRDRKVTLVKVRKVTDSILRVDTVFTGDTVKAIVERERVACNSVVITCDEQKAALLRENVNLAGQLRIEKKKHPSRFACAGPLAATTKGIGLGVACGIRFP